MHGQLAQECQLGAHRARSTLRRGERPDGSWETRGPWTVVLADSVEYQQRPMGERPYAYRADLACSRGFA